MYAEPTEYFDANGGTTSRIESDTWGAMTVLVGAGLRTRPLLGALRLELGVRYLAYKAPVSGVRDAPVRIGLEW